MNRTQQGRSSKAFTSLQLSLSPQFSFLFHVETSKLICIKIRLTGFYMI